MSEWTRTSVDALIADGRGSIKTGPFGTALKASEYSETGVPVISVGEVGYGELRLRPDTPRVDEDVTSRLSEYILCAGDIVFGRKGAVDRSAWVKPEQAGWFLGSDGIRLRLPPEVDSRFVSYHMASEATRDWLLRHASGSTMLSLNQGTLGRVSLLLPSLPEQRAIAEVLGALDDKIAANTKLVSTMDVMAQALFRSAQAESSMVPLSETAEFVNGKAFTKGASGTGRVVVRIAELNSGLGGSTVYSDVEVEEKHVARAGDILFAWSGSLTLHRWYRDDAIINQHIFKVIPKVGYPSWLVYELIRVKLPDFKSIAADKATTMGHIQRHHLDETVVVPAPEGLARIRAVMDGLWLQALAAEQESLTLAALRDTLLPELMSGRLRVKDADKTIEEVL